MINYPLPPSPDLACREPLYVFRSFAFSEEEIDKIVEIGERVLRLSPAATGFENACYDKKIRNSQVSWVPLNTDTQWIYDRIGGIVTELNGQFFQFDMYGFAEEIQYTVYHGSENSEDANHYTWHIDKGNAAMCPRKISVSIQLSDPSEYEGGNLELFTETFPTVLKKQQGMLYAFPSFVVHRVTPVTAGVRRTLVVWLTGPKFK